MEREDVKNVFQDLKHVVWAGIFLDPRCCFARVISSSVLEHGSFKVSFICIHITHANFHKDAKHIL